MMALPKPNPANFDERHFRHTLGRFPSGVTVIIAEHPQDGSPIGLTISSFSSVSLAPPMVLWTLTNEASSLPWFKTINRYVIHVLGARQAALAQRFARGPQAGRFEGIKLQRTSNNSLMLAEPDCAAWFECYNSAQHLAGDHTIFVAQVQNCQYNDNAPLIYHAGNFQLSANLR